MIRPTALACLLLVCAVGLGAAADKNRVLASAPAYPGCVKIFDGNTFNGWEADPSTWSIGEGAMRGLGGSSRLAYTKAGFGSFRLIFTARLNPVNGDHLGVSPFRDYSLLLPAAKDRSVASLPRKQLETQSSESAGSSHPAVFFMLDVPASTKTPSMIHDEEKNTWRVAVPLNLAVKGESKPVTQPVSIIVVGVSEGG